MLPFSKSDPFALKVLKLLLAACLATPILAWSGVIFPYTVPKVFGFRVLVEIAAIFYLYLALKSPASFFSFGGRPWRGFLNLSVLIFLAASFLTAVFGVDFYSSFWGNLERGMGVFSLTHFIAWFFMVLGVSGFERVERSKENNGKNVSCFLPESFFHQLARVSVLTSALVSILAIGQYFFSLGTLLPQSGRVYSLAGNAGVLGSYLIFNIFLAGYLAFLSWREKQKNYASFVVNCLLLTVSCLALLLTGTRGAWLGFLVGIFIFLALLACQPRLGWQAQRKKMRRQIIWSLVIVFILVGSLFLFRHFSFVKNNAVLSRLTSISLQDKTAQNRLILWRGAWRVWQEKLLLGWGGENFEIAANKYFDPRLAPYEAWYDRAHNFIFDYGVTSGWLGLLGYLTIFGLAFYCLFKKLKPDFFFSAVFISLLGAYLVQNFFIFDSFLSYLMLFFILAIIGYRSDTVMTKEESAEGYSSTDRSAQNGKKGSQCFAFNQEPLSFFKKIILLFAIGYLPLAIYAYSLKPFLAARYANQVLSLPAARATEAVSLFKDALALGSFASGEIAYQVALDYIGKIGQNPALAQNEEFYNIVSTELNKTIKRSPGQSRNYVALAWLNLYFSGPDKSRLTQSLQLAQKILELSPNKKEAYSLLVAGYVLSGQPQKAEEAVDLALAIDAKMGEEIRSYYEKFK